jgi:hypothetical protein
MVIETCTIEILACTPLDARGPLHTARVRLTVSDVGRCCCGLLWSRRIGAVQALRFPAQRGSALTALNRIATQLA